MSRVMQPLLHCEAKITSHITTPYLRYCSSASYQCFSFLFVCSTYRLDGESLQINFKMYKEVAKFGTSTYPKHINARHDKP